MESRLIRRLTPYFFYGWVIVGVSFFAQMLSGLSIQGLATYVIPLEREFGWSRAAIAGGRAFQQADNLLGPLSGWLVDTYGPRRLMTVGVVLFAIAYLLFGLVESLWAYYAACLLMAVANTLLGLLVVSYSINQWFRRLRTSALGLAVTGFAASGIVVIPAIVWAQVELGWRSAALLTGLGVLLIGLPIVQLMRTAPEPYGLLPDGDSPLATRSDQQAVTGGGQLSFTFAEALHTRAYWLLSASNALALATLSAVLVHQFAHMEESFSREAAALVLAVLNAFNLFGRLTGGLLGDRLTKHRLLGFDMALSAASLLVLAFATSLPGLLLYGALFGLSWGVRTPVSNSLQGDYFGRAHFGRILGLSLLLTTPGAVLLPILIGLLADLQGNYVLSFITLAGAAALASLLLFLARRPPDPPRLRQITSTSPAGYAQTGYNTSWRSSR